MAVFLRNVAFILHGSKHFGKEGYARASKKFNPSVMERRLDGQVAVVTGANQGLGFQASEDLAKRGATLYMVCRSEERGKEAVERIRASTGNADVHLKLCDVSSLSAISHLADELDQPGSKLNFLVLNAGVLLNEKQKSVDGLDLGFATNVLGCFVLTARLEGLLKRSAPSRVIFVSSGGMLTQPLEPEVIKGPSEPYDGTKEYAKDKRRQVAIAERFAELWHKSGVGVYSMHPGWTVTEGVKKSIPGFYNYYKDKFREPWQGADTIIYLCLEDQKKLLPGGFYLDRAPQTKNLTLSFCDYSTAMVDLLWIQLTKLAAPVLEGYKARVTADEALQTYVAP